MAFPASAARAEGEQNAVRSLRAAFRGDLVGPADPGYDRLRRVWNGCIDRRPALIARCAGVADVIDSVRFARRHGLTRRCAAAGTAFPGCRCVTAGWSSTCRR
ncbi:hypothetical protein GCM10011581_40850 [Saccharopolyspora subtropica]|uniref:Uncharacterized protein n=1 Tax=Saccharopolyspora thermophila TaxID=89367 RepID=A0A917NGS6_9PSEU|nr:FAD-dependent oxidoreductase [Saccharopolyspora subtropica]GGI99502.1 hypothetical protein GCM10011581_40850 [Saccharopolyspora subtropica]